jgi:hypothetical protein
LFGIQKVRREGRKENRKMEGRKGIRVTNLLARKCKKGMSFHFLGTVFDGALLGAGTSFDGETVPADVGLSAI